jgi:hypothetical protein
VTGDPDYRGPMLPTDQLHADDLDALAQDGMAAGQPLDAVARLTGAVDQDRIADRQDIGYALMLASELSAEAGDLPAALGLAERAIEAYRTHGNGKSDDAYARASRAGLLIRSGRGEEGLAELTALRPLLETDPTATYLVNVLEENGHAELAEEWLTEALRGALARARTAGHDLAAEAAAAAESTAAAEASPGSGQAPGAGPAPGDAGDDDTAGDAGPDGDDAAGGAEDARQRAVAMAYGLAQQRHRIRGELDLPHDELDHLADQMKAATGDSDDDHLDGDVALIFWPRDEFDAVLRQWPALAEAYGETWEEHRTETERALVELSTAGAGTLGVLPGSAAGFAPFVPGVDAPLDEDALQDYFETRVDEVEPLPWPPGRNEPCWCGSGSKYKKCCLPRSRA